MTVKVVCYGVRAVEVPFFEKLNKYGYQLILEATLLNDENVVLTKGAQAVIVRGNCKTDRKNIAKMSDFGVKYLLTRTVGFNHIDLEATKEFGLEVARVPAYSPNAISELAVTLAMTLLRNVAHTLNKTRIKDFTVDAAMFSKEIRNCTVGVLGTGRIGLTTAKLFKGLGAKVVAFDVFENQAAKEVVDYMPLDKVLAISDVVSVHIPYIKGETDKFIDTYFLSQMKTDAVLVNTSRGELQDDEAILAAIESNKLRGFGTDVFAGEAEFFFKNMEQEPLSNPIVEQLISYYPRVIVTPHIGSYTDEALTNMVEISYKNLHEFLTTGTCENIVGS